MKLERDEGIYVPIKFLFQVHSIRIVTNVWTVQDLYIL